MAKNYVLDSTGEIEKCVNYLIKKFEDFTLLENVHFLYVWKMNGPDYDGENVPLHALTKRCSNRERDLYNRDVELRVHLNSWMDMTKLQKTRLIFRQLLSVQIVTDEEHELVYDDDERLKIFIIPPDMVLKAFSREVEEFGLPVEYTKLVRDLSASNK